jgi:hypothetical protein
MPRIHALGNRTKKTYTILVLIVALIGSLCTTPLVTQAQTGSKMKPNPNQHPYYVNIPFTKVATEIPKYRKAVERLGGVMDCQLNRYDKKRLDKNGDATTYDCVKLVVLAQCKDHNDTRIRMLFEESLLALEAYKKASLKNLRSFFEKKCSEVVKASKAGLEIDVGKRMLDMRYMNFRDPAQKHTGGYTNHDVANSLMNGDAPIVYIRGNEGRFDDGTLFHEIAHAVVQYNAIYGKDFPRKQYPHEFQGQKCEGLVKILCNNKKVASLMEGHAVYTDCKYKNGESKKKCLEEYAYNEPAIVDANEPIWTKENNCLGQFASTAYFCAYYIFETMQNDFNNALLPQHKATIQKNPNFFIKEILKGTKNIDTYDALKKQIKRVFQTYTTLKNYDVDFAEYSGRQKALKQIFEVMRAYDLAQLKEANKGNQANNPQK